MVLKEILSRRSVREFRNDAVAEGDLLEIIRAGEFAPTARNTRAVEFIVVKNQETKDKIFEIVGQEYVKIAPVLIIPIVDETKSVCPVEDLSVASENMFLQATALGLGSVWKNIGKECQISIKNILNIPDTHLVINIIPIGYPTVNPAAHPNADFSEAKIHKEKW